MIEMIEAITDADENVLFDKAADLISEKITQLLETKAEIVLAVPGGRSVPKIFDKLKNMPWDKVHIFMIDERLVPLDDEYSNFKLVAGHLLDAPRKNMHPFIYRPDTDDKGLHHYEDELKKHGGSYDIILLSSGEDGHVGALYPNHNSINNNAEFYITMEDSPKPPPARMSSSRKLLLRSKVAIILFMGTPKEEAYRKFLDESLPLEACPAKLAADIPECYIITNITFK